ncbi:homeobox protein 2-like [Apis cerana]|uniref:homeobox protein 2-like n=1 Tax=Apis cerana TaxID=7461 RepID=UPI002B228369|nr:homeobox protein 2-like [Apis cerana]
MQNDEKLRNHESEKMIERLMRTTTKNPWKKKSGDQGVEYSDYYSDDEVLQDVAANKILPQLIDSRDPYDRLTRQTLNFTSYRDCSRPFDRNLRKPYYPDYDTRSRKYRGFKNDYVNSLNNFQNYPTVNDRIPTLNRNSRVLGPDEANFNYATNYGVLDYRNQNYDTSYPAPNVPAEVPEDPQVFEGNNVSELSNNYETFDPNKSDGGVRQPIVESQNPEQFEYSNDQYEIPGEPFQSLSTNMPQNLNLNGAVEPLIQPQYLNNYQQLDTSSLSGNFDQTNIMNQAESMRIPNADNYFPIQFYNNQQETQQENQLENQDKSMENYALQPTFYNRPSVNLPNAMDQPLGKILESLGINVNGGQNKEMNMNENNNRQILPYSNDRTLDVINFIRKRPYEESTGYGDNNFRGLEYQSFLSKNRNNMKEDQRQSNQNFSFGKENVDRDHTNITGAVRDTKQVANEILDTIMEELEDLKDDRLKNNKNREGLPCRLSGSWSTTQAGVKLDMRVVNRTIVVTVSNFTSSRLQESLLNETWNVSGHVPFKRGLPFTLIATHNYTNSIAVFVGACRVCQGIDTIAGVWSVARQPKDCKDLQAATSVFNDIFRKTQLSSLKEGENTENATLKHNKTKS